MKWITGLLICCGGVVLLSGCQSNPPTEPEVATVSLTKTGPMDAAELAYQLSRKTWCTNDEACSMMLHFLDGEDPFAAFEERTDDLRQRGVMPEGWKLNADEPVTKGTLAYMVCRAMEQPGGLMMHLLPGRRYAYREAVELNLMAKGSENEPLTGPEVVGVMGRASRMMNQNQQVVD
ncbi:MAG: hypothetical protein JW709_03355 [Sedimentisphaerales bacterium]|nr:hypothetical protein [Sedimentisphaerales bacterium]